MYIRRILAFTAAGLLGLAGAAHAQSGGGSSGGGSAAGRSSDGGAATERSAREPGTPPPAKVGSVRADKRREAGGNERDDRTRLGTDRAPMPLHQPKSDPTMTGDRPDAPKR